jgi:hypothetical protein
MSLLKKLSWKKEGAQSEEENLSQLPEEKLSVPEIDLLNDTKRMLTQEPVEKTKPNFFDPFEWSLIDMGDNDFYLVSSNEVSKNGLMQEAYDIDGDGEAEIFHTHVAGCLGEVSDKEGNVLEELTRSFDINNYLSLGKSKNEENNIGLDWSKRNVKKGFLKRYRRVIVEGVCVAATGICLGIFAGESEKFYEKERVEKVEQVYRNDLDYDLEFPIVNHVTPQLHLPQIQIIPRIDLQTKQSIVKKVYDNHVNEYRETYAPNKCNWLKSFGDKYEECLDVVSEQYAGDNVNPVDIIERYRSGTLNLEALE